MLARKRGQLIDLIRGFSRALKCSDINNVRVFFAHFHPSRFVLFPSSSLNEL